MRFPDPGATYRLERSSQKRRILCRGRTKCECPQSSSLKAHHCLHTRCLAEVLAISLGKAGREKRASIPAGALAACRSTGGSALTNMQHMKHLRGRHPKTPAGAWQLLHQRAMLVVQEALQLPTNAEVSMLVNGKGDFILHWSVDLSSQLNHRGYHK